MRDTVKSVLKESFDAHTRTPRETWMVQWPGQVVLAGADPVFCPAFCPAVVCHTVSTLHSNVQGLECCSSTTFRWSELACRRNAQQQWLSTQQTCLRWWWCVVAAAVDSIMWTADTAAAIRANKLQQHADRLTTELMEVSFMHQLAAAAGLHSIPTCANAPRHSWACVRIAVSPWLVVKDMLDTAAYAYACNPAPAGCKQGPRPAQQSATQDPKCADRYRCPRQGCCSRPGQQGCQQ